MMRAVFLNGYKIKGIILVKKSKEGCGHDGRIVPETGTLP